MTVLDNPELVKLLVDRLNLYRSESNKRSFEFIAQKAENYCSEINKSWIYRLSEKSSKLYLHPKKVVALAKVIGNGPFVNNIREKVAKDLLGDSQRKDSQYADYLTSNDLAVSLDFEKAIVQKERYPIYECCTSTEGATKEDIRKIPGIENAELVLDELVRLGYIYVDENSRYHAAVKDFGFSFESGQKQLEAFTSCYNPDNAGKERNYLMVKGLPLNREGVREAQVMWREFNNKLRKLCKDKPGTYKMMAVGFMDALHSGVFEKEEGDNDVQ